MKYQYVIKETMVMENLMKSANDKREYRVITLENGLTALLISDLHSLEEAQKKSLKKGPRSDDEVDCEDEEEGGGGDEDESEESDEEEEEDDEEEEEEVNEGDEEENGEEEEGESEADCNDSDDDDPKRKVSRPLSAQKLSAAALCIGTGSFSDPGDLPGLAHFLEHMLFMGSEKYPDENEFDSYIKKHGGSNNAFTDCERTVFYFDIQQKYLEGGLDRFAQFFVRPLMKKDSVERELKAVDSEWNLSLTSDRFRKEQLLGSFAKTGHPMGKFMWGNLKSLKDDPKEKNLDPHDQLHDYYTRHYSAHYMTLAITSKDSLDDLEKLVTKIFSAVPNNGLEKPTFTDLPHPMDTDRFTMLYKIIPVKNTHQVDLTWSMPPLLKYYRTKPLHYLGWLVGHEAKGSILAELKKKFWATGLNSGNSESGFEHNSTWAMFSISVDLTDDGMNNVVEVVNVIFEYLSMLRRMGPQEWVWKEIQTSEDNGFRWKEQCDPVSYVENLCENMQLYPPQHYLTGDELLYDFEPQIIKKCTEWLSPRKCNITMLSKRFEAEAQCVHEERWYGTKYSAEEIPEEWLKVWESNECRFSLHLPSPNIYIATDFTLQENSIYSERPVMLTDNPMSRLWYKGDQKFCVPKAYLCFKLTSPVFQQTPLSAAMFDVFLRALEHSLTEVAYAAELAQLSYTLRGNEKAMVIKIDGFNQKLPLLFETIMNNIINFQITQDLLDATIEQLQKVYYNEYIKPNVLVKDLRLLVLQDRYWTTVDKQHFLPTITTDLLQAFVCEFRSKLFVESLVQGNVTESEARGLERRMLDTLRSTTLPNNAHPEIRVVELPAGSTVLRVRNFNAEDHNSVLTNYYQHGPASLRESVVNELLVMLMEEPVFDVLRTQHQLGYNVSVTNRQTAGVLAFSITVCSQADKFTMVALDDHVEKFIVQFDEMLEKLTEEEFRTTVNALMALKACEDGNMGEEVERNWWEIANHCYVFDRLNKEIEVLREVTKADVLTWYRQHIPSNPTHKKLSVQVVGNMSEEQIMDTTTSLEEGEAGNIPRPIPNAKAWERRSLHSPKLAFLPLEDSSTATAIVDIKDFKDRRYLYPVSRIVP